MATSTPWGPAVQSTKIAKGILSYSTSGHGGLHLTRTRVEAMPGQLQAYLATTGNITKHGDAWLEEDCEWAYAAISFPADFPKDDVECAEKTIRDNFPIAWELIYGRPLVVGESAERDRLDFYVKHKNNYLVTSTWGPWALHVPDDMIGLAAIVGGWQKDGPNVVSYWLVLASEYVIVFPNWTFVVDPTIHQRLDVELGEYKPISFK